MKAQKSIKDDLLAGVVVFFVAVPLCLGIAVASGAPPLAGLISGIIGGIVVGFISKSGVSVSGPAAGLITIVLGGVETLGGSLQAFGLAIFIAGIIQILLGWLRAGTVAYFFPSNVIKGMLAAIGITIILKQFPHFIGYDKDFEGDLAFWQPDGENTFSEIFIALNNLVPGIFIVGFISLLTIVLWDHFKAGILKVVPGALLGVAVGLLLNLLFQTMGWSSLVITESEHLVNIPVLENIGNASSLISLPDFSALTNPNVYIIAVTIAIVASIETLLTIEATDKIDPEKRVTPTNRELMAQGVGNTLSGLLGGLPITSVIIRSSANINSGGRNKTSTIFHGLLLLLGVLFFAQFLNKIPLASLAAILLVTGYKLANPKLFREFFQRSYDQWLPFLVTIIAILLTDLLKGIAIGMTVSIIFLLRKNIQKTHYFDKERVDDKEFIKIVLPQEVSFLNKASLRITLDRISEESNVLIDASETFYIDFDVLEIIREFVNEKSIEKNIQVLTKGFKEEYDIPHKFDIEMRTT